MTNKEIIKYLAKQLFKGKVRNYIKKWHLVIEKMQLEFGNSSMCHWDIEPYNAIIKIDNVYDDTLERITYAKYRGCDNPPINLGEAVCRCAVEYLKSRVGGLND